jgi:hypothetical protein
MMLGARVRWREVSVVPQHKSKSSLHSRVTQYDIKKAVSYESIVRQVRQSIACQLTPGTTVHNGGFTP